MKTFNFSFPIGGAIHFRGIIGKISLIERPVGNLLTAFVDARNAMSGKVLIINHRGGKLRATSKDEVYNELQIYCTPLMEAGHRIVTSKGVFDKNNKLIKPPKYNGIEKLGIEIDYKELLLGPNIWFSWMVNRVGRITINIKGDGKTLRTKSFQVEQMAPEMLNNITTPSDLLFRIHTDSKPNQKDKIIVGDAVAFGFTLAEIKEITEIKIET